MANNSTLKMKMLALWEILQADSEGSSPLSTNEICRKLGERGIRCERKSVSTDVRLLLKHGYGVETRKIGRDRVYWVPRRPTEQSRPQAGAAADADLHSGELYDPMEASLLDRQLDCLELLYDYNATRPRDQARRAALLGQMLAEVGENCYIEPPLRANWGGRHVHFGKNVYANFNLTLVDDTHIYVGDNTMFGPNVTVCTAAHPILPSLREKGLQYNAPVRIGRNCWIGAGAILLPGVTVGDNSVIGAGSIVTRDIPANVVAVGNPCRVLRPIGEAEGACSCEDPQPAPADPED